MLYNLISRLKLSSATLMETCRLMLSRSYYTTPTCCLSAEAQHPKRLKVLKWGRNRARRPMLRSVKAAHQLSTQHNDATFQPLLERHSIIHSHVSVGLCQLLSLLDEWKRKWCGVVHHTSACISAFQSNRLPISHEVEIVMHLHGHVITWQA